MNIIKGISQRKIKSLKFTLQRLSFSVSLSFQVFDTLRQFNRFGPSKYLSTLSRSSAGRSLKKSLNSKLGNFSCNLHRCSGPHDSKNTSTNLSKSSVESMRSSFSNLNEKIKTACALVRTIIIIIKLIENTKITISTVSMIYLGRSVFGLSSIWYLIKCVTSFEN